MVVVIVVVATIIGVTVYLTKDSDTSSDEPSSDQPSSDQPSSDQPSSGGPYRREAVATDTPQCSQIGKGILDANGSAVDAAIAAMFCLGVVSMHSSGIGGGGIMLVYNRSLQEASVIVFRETAPAATAKLDMFKGNEKKAQKGIPVHVVCSEDFLLKNQGNTITRTVKGRRMAECRINWTELLHFYDVTGSSAAVRQEFLSSTRKLVT